MKLLGILPLLALALAGCTAPTPPEGPAPPSPPVSPPEGVEIRWQAPVELGWNGYEPSISADAAGTLYITAHKELNRPETWGYAASWFALSRDNGQTWEAPCSPQCPLTLWQTFVGDEGDIAVDGRGWVYFLDTYLGDNHIHAWSGQGRSWEYSEPAQRTTAIDDRPWISAQGDGIVHYLGNNGAEVRGGRFWYYRSTDGGLTFSVGTPVPGSGWSHVDADRRGERVYVVTEGGGADAPGPILAYASGDAGASWSGPGAALSSPVTIAEREGVSGDVSTPYVSVGSDGTVWVIWDDCGTPQSCGGGSLAGSTVSGAEEPSLLFLARSTDHGQTWQSWDVSMPGAFHQFPNVCAGPDGSVGVVFFASDALPSDASTPWHIYGGVALDAHDAAPVFAFTRADPKAAYTGNDQHALHDFIECAVSPDGALNVAYHEITGAMSEDGPRFVWFVRGAPEA